MRWIKIFIAEKQQSLGDLAGKLGVFLILAACSFVTNSATSAEIWTGIVHPKDADTWFYVRPSLKKPGRTIHVQIRPSGIDAPELSQPCDLNGAKWYPGWTAGRWLTGYLAGREVTCEGTGSTTYGRAVANCTVAGADLQEIIVAAGWAFDYPKFSRGKYAAAEARARAAGRGVHAGICEKPWIWRRKNF